MTIIIILASVITMVASCTNLHIINCTTTPCQNKRYHINFCHYTKRGSHVWLFGASYHQENIETDVFLTAFVP